MNNEGVGVLMKITQYLAKRLLKVDPETNMCHAIHNDSPNIIIGHDYDYPALLEELQKALDIRIAGEKAMNSGHGIAVLWEEEPYYVFFEHNPQEMKKYLQTIKDYEE